MRRTNKSRDFLFWERYCKTKQSGISNNRKAREENQKQLEKTTPNKVSGCNQRFFPRDFSRFCFSCFPCFFLLYFDMNNLLINALACIRKIQIELTYGLGTAHVENMRNLHLKHQSTTHKHHDPRQSGIKHVYCQHTSYSARTSKRRR